VDEFELRRTLSLKLDLLPRRKSSPANSKPKERRRSRRQRAPSGSHAARASFWPT
jgi:hypothetical protein